MLKLFYNLLILKYKIYKYKNILETAKHFCCHKKFKVKYLWIYRLSCLGIHRSRSNRRESAYFYIEKVTQKKGHLYIDRLCK